MLSFALSTASTYFHLPVDEQEDKDINDYQRKYITWTADSAASSASSSSPTQPLSPLPSPERTKALGEVLAHDDLYAILGVSKSDDLDKLALRRAYLTRSKACHPDKFPDNPDATYAFQKIAVAYSVLSQPASRRSYDARSPFSKYDAFSAHPTGHAENTFRSIVMSVFDDFLEGDLEMIRSLLKAINDINPSLSMGEEGINSVLNSLQRIRERALTCRICIYALHAELTRLLELQHSFRQLSYFDILGRTRLTIQLTRITLSLPIALEKAIAEQNVNYGHNTDVDVRPADHNADAILPRQVTLLIRGVDIVLEHMEGMLKK
ncbi:DnaJ domain-containing protein [Mycena galopus ATCC 62051]|nr:DnaJ domain-containing protein [Mycena galopus ATCC 62051]